MFLLNYDAGHVINYIKKKATRFQAALSIYVFAKKCFEFILCIRSKDLASCYYVQRNIWHSKILKTPCSLFLTLGSNYPFIDTKNSSLLCVFFI